MSSAHGNSAGDGRRYTGDGVPHTVASIPLTDVDHSSPQQASIGGLVKDATSQVSTLVRSEIELAKAEVTGEVKRGLQVSVFFVLALTVLLFSSFFFFFFLAELLDLWLPRWAAFLIVFGIMVLATIVFALIGYLRFRKIKAPEKTIESLKETKTVLPGADSGAPAGRHART
ncbi:phage holin family protein [Rhodococcus rhodnii]|uniref:phage holin family protein n=1 Tax=Rhodococcus rhodnii TaxID=38312 RepID=UPI00039F9E4C|nr:phage holin family protein [Rhodococcus rhodnii]